MVAFFDHEFRHTYYENAVISGLAVIGLQDDGGWVSADGRSGRRTPGPRRRTGRRRYGGAAGW